MSTKFHLEEDMTYHVKTWFESQGFDTKLEFRTPWGICDLVAVRLDDQYVESRLSLGQIKPIGPLKRVAILEEIPDNGSLSVEEIARRTETLGIHEGLSQELRRLLAGKFLKEPTRDKYQRIQPHYSKRNRVLAVEMKLDRIEEVIGQATSNLTFATKSYVALPSVRAQRFMATPRSEEVTASGIGILSVDRGGCTVLAESKGSSGAINPAVHSHCIERFWRTFIDRTA
jgi:hypothetical protein